MQIRSSLGEGWKCLGKEQNELDFLRCNEICADDKVVDVYNSI